MATGKITVELDYEITDSTGGTGVVLSHPDVEGRLYFSASSEKMIKLQLEALDVNQNLNLSPVEQIIASAGKLTEGLSQLKETFKK